MFQYFWGGLTTLPLLKQGKSRSISWENPHGEKGRGGMAESSLGPSRKGAPFILGMAAGSVITLAEIEGAGVIDHFFITVSAFSRRDCDGMRELILRMYWDGEERPSVEVSLTDFFNCSTEGECVVNPARSMHCYIPMPFWKKARITLENRYEEEISVVAYQVDYVLTEELPEWIAYFRLSAGVGK